MTAMDVLPADRLMELIDLAITIGQGFLFVIVLGAILAVMFSLPPEEE